MIKQNIYMSLNAIYANKEHIKMYLLSFKYLINNTIII